MTDIVGVYINSTGAWGSCKKVYAGEAIGNLIFNFALGKLLGLVGILLASLITTLCFSFLAIGAVLYNRYFKEYSFKIYLYSQLKYFILFICSLITSCVAFNYLKNFYSTIVIQIILGIFISLLIPNIIFYIGLRKDKCFLRMREWLKSKYLMR